MFAQERTIRHSRTTARRRAVLDGALACFTELGFAATTMADVCRRAGASVGSVYHHFKSKEQLAGVLYLEGLRDYQEGLLGELRRVDLGRSGLGRRLIRVTVQHYLRWVETHADWARYLYEFGHASFIQEISDDLATLNRAFFAETGQFLSTAIERKELRRLPRDVTFAVIVGPAREFARRWLRDRTGTPMETARELLADAAWRSMRLPKEKQTGP